MSDLYKNPMGDGSKFWAGDILTSMGINVDEVVGWEIGENSNGSYIIFPSGLAICFQPNGYLEYEINTRLSWTWTYPMEFSDVLITIPIRTAAHLDKKFTTATYGVLPNNSSALIRAFNTYDSFVTGDRIYVKLITIGYV